MKPKFYRESFLLVLELLELWWVTRPVMIALTRMFSMLNPSCEVTRKVERGLATSWA
jgi:hypothetical protein